MGAGEPFDFVGGATAEVGVVCVHGFTGSPYEMRYLGAAIARTGMTARGLVLPGHGTSVAELDATRWQDWAGAVDREVDAMVKRCRKVAVVGQSLGGLLALHAAAHRPEIAAVATLAAPLWLDGIAGRIARLLTGPPGRGSRLLHRIGALPKLGGSDVRDRRARAENPSYRAVPVRALGELVSFMKVVDAELTQITAPVLVLHAHRDHTAPVACAARIAERTRAHRVRLLTRSFHLIAIDVERDLVAAEVTAFLAHHATRPLVPPGDMPCAT